MPLDPAFGYWALQVARALLWVADLLGEAFGETISYGSRREREEAWADGRTAQVTSVVARAQYILVMPFHSMANFLCCHDEYVRPEVVLRRPNVCLFFVDEQRAVFCVGKEGQDLYDTKSFPFLYMSLYNSAEKLLVLPLPEFHRLADQLGNPDGRVPVSALGMTARCGSTLLSQMLNRVPGTRSISEPMATVNVYQLRYQGKITDADASRMLRSCLRLYCKTEPGSDVKRIFLKLVQFNNVQMPEIASSFPNFKILFNTRLPVPSVRSFCKIFSLMEGTLFYKLGLNWHYFRAFPFPQGTKYDAIMDTVDRNRQNMDDEQVSLMLFASGLTAFLEHKHLYEHVVLYENLVKNPREETKKLFSVLGIPEDEVDTALEATGIDSQGAIFDSTARSSEASADGGKDRVSELFRNRLDIDLGADTTLEQFQALLGIEAR